MIAPEINIITQPIHSQILNDKNISLYIARLDLIHPIISGNKLFKLHYFIEQAKKANKKIIVTLGGAYSNHLAATAYYCQRIDLQSIGIVRGEEPLQKSHTLIACENNGMKLLYVSREVFIDINEEKASLLTGHQKEDILFIPEGGYDKQGAEGASLIIPCLSGIDATHFCVAVGTATTLAGLVAAAGNQHRIIGIPVLKGMKDIDERLNKLLHPETFRKPVIFDDFHFGGYASKTPELINFMNEFYNRYQIPTDFVYTGKLMYGIFKKIEENYFPAGSRIVCIHTGGLQGNLSLPENTLVF